MKKIYFVVVISIFIGFVAGNKAKGGCPPNWAVEGISFQVGNCLYFAEYCYRCGVTGPDPSNVKVTRYGKLPGQFCDDNGITIEDVVQAMLQRIRQRFLENCIIPPCSSGIMARFIVEYPLCHKHFNHAWTDPSTGERKHFHWWESCNNELYYCQRITLCCYSENNKYDCEPLSIEPQGSALSCQQGLILPPPGYTWDEDWETDCYLDTSCQ